jgi:hypothetical protein
MKKNILVLFTLCSVCGFNLQLKAQNSQHEGIDKAIKNYFEGYMTGNIEKLALAFDTTSAHLYAPKLEAGKTTITPNKLHEVVKRWANNVQKKPYTESEIQQSYYKILFLDVSDEKAAIAKIEIKLGQKLYYDYLSLYKIGEQWKIVSKTFVQK